MTDVVSEFVEGQFVRMTFDVRLKNHQENSGLGS